MSPITWPVGPTSTDSVPLTGPRTLPCTVTFRPITTTCSRAVASIWISPHVASALPGWAPMIRRFSSEIARWQCGQGTERALAETFIIPRHKQHRTIRVPACMNPIVTRGDRSDQNAAARFPQAETLSATAGSPQQSQIPGQRQHADTGPTWTRDQAWRLLASRFRLAQREVSRDLLLSSNWYQQLGVRAKHRNLLRMAVNQHLNHRCAFVSLANMPAFESNLAPIMDPSSAIRRTMSARATSKYEMLRWEGPVTLRGGRPNGRTTSASRSG